MRSWVRILEWGTAALMPVAAGLNYVHPNNHVDVIRAILSFAQSWIFLIILGLAVANLFLKILGELLDLGMASRTATKHLLDCLQTTYFSDVQEEQLHFHRVTLFRARKQFLFWGRPVELIPYVRAGQNYQHCKTRFKIDPDHDNGNEGIAGKAWFEDSKAEAELPEWPEDTRFPTDDDRCENYAKSGNVPVLKAAALNIKSRSIKAYVVRGSTGKRWGSLVFDSRVPDGLKERPERERIVTFTLKTLTSMVT